MDNSDANGEAEQRRSGGAFFRHMLRNVKPEHVAEMIDMLRRMQDPEKPILVPREGPWAMKMPEGTRDTNDSNRKGLTAAGPTPSAHGGAS